MDKGAQIVRESRPNCTALPTIGKPRSTGHSCCVKSKRLICAFHWQKIREDFWTCGRITQLQAALETKEGEAATKGKPWPNFPMWM